MISFAPTEDELLAKSMFQEFAQNIIRPAARAIDNAAEIQLDLLAQIWDLGLVSALLDNTEAAQSRILNCLLLEEFSLGDASLAVAASAPIGYVQAVMAHGSPRQKQTVRTAFNRPDFHMAAILVQEPGFGFTPERIATSAKSTGDGYILNGAKSFVPLPAICESLLVIAQHNGKLEAFMVPASAAGVEFQMPKGTIGLKALSLCEVRFRDVRLSREARLGEDLGCYAEGVIDNARSAIGAILTGLARAVFEYITPYTQERVAHGSALAKKQSVAFRLADMAIDVPSMRWMCWQSALAAEPASRARAARLTQIHCADRALQIADEGVQLMGGHGYIRDNPVERWYRDARTLSLLEGIVGV